MSVNESTTMSRADYKEVQSFIRWAKIGAPPAVGRADGVLEVLAIYKDKAWDAVTSMAQEIRRGVLVSFDACKAAEAELARVGCEPAHVEDDVERARG